MSGFLATEPRTDLLSAALQYAAEGIPVFPCEPRGKRPLGRLAPHGHKDATTDRATIESWWSTEPAANVGLPTGGTFMVLDVDPRHGGEDSFAELLTRWGWGTSTTWLARTQSGGEHYYFTTDPHVSSCAVGIAPGLDVRDRGGYVVAAPSVGEAGSYRWVYGGPGSGVPLAAQPPWLVRGRLLVKAPPQPTRNMSTARRRGDGRVTPQGYPEGRRDAGLFELASAWRARGVSFADALDAIKASAGMCTPPYSARRAADMVGRVWAVYPEGCAR